MSTQEMFPLDEHQGGAASNAPDDANRAADVTGESTASQEAGSSDDPGASSEPHAESYKTAMLEERKKRQDLQRQVDQMSGRIEGMAQGAAPQAEPEDRDGRFFDAPSKFVDDTYQARDDAKFAKRMKQTADRAATKHDDYQDLVTRFGPQAERDPDVYADIRYAHDPAEQFYQWAKKQSVSSGNGQKFHGKSMEEIEAAVRAKMEAEAKGNAGVSAAEKTTPTTAGARGSGTGAEGKPTSDPDEQWGLDKYTA